MSIYSNDRQEALETFDRIANPTTSVAIAHLEVDGDSSKEMEINPYFYLLNWVEVDEKKVVKINGKVRLPLSNTPGDILSIRHRGEVRGYRKKAGKKGDNYFRHVVTFDMSLRKKNISIKLSAKKAHMCGIKDENMVHEGIHYLRQHLQQMRENRDSLKGVDVKKGEKIMLLDPSRKDAVPADEGFVYDYTIDKQDILKHENKLVRELFADITIYSEFICVRDWLLSTYIPENISISKIENVMFNYYFHPGFMFHRDLLLTLVNQEKFVPVGDKAAQTAMQLQVDIKDARLTAKKKKRVHSFIIYSVKGCITMTGPDPMSMREIFADFYLELKHIRRYIEDKSKKVVDNKHPCLFPENMED